MRTSGRIVLCHVADDAAFNRVNQAIIDAGLQAIRLGVPSQEPVAIEARVVAIVYDLHGPDPEASVDVVRRWRRLHPKVQVLLYHAPTAAAAGLAGRLGQLPGVAARVQVPGLPGEERQLAKLLTELVSSGPGLMVRAIVTVLCPRAPAPARVFIESLIDRLEQGGIGAPEVRNVADQGGTKPWRVARACHAAQLPTPERLIEWLSFLYVVAAAEWERVSIAKAATTVGVSGRYIRKLRASLLPDVARLTGAVAPDVLPHAIMRFGQVCGLSQEQATAAANRLTA